MSAFSRQRGEAGQGLAEFAIVLFFFLLLLGGLIQVALILWTQNTVAEIARDTARWAVVQSSCDGTTRSGLATTANKLAVERRLVNYSAGSWSSAPSLSAGGLGVSADWQSPDSTFVTDCPPSDNQMVWTVHVRVRHNVPSFIFPEFICPASGCVVASETELRMEPKKR